MSIESHPKIIELTKTLTGDLSNNGLRWDRETQLEVISTLKETGQKKLDYLKNLLEQLQSQVLRAPLAKIESEEDTSEARLFALRKLDKTFEEAKEVFARWKLSGKRLREVFNKATSDEKTVKDETVEEPREGGEGERRMRQWPRDIDKVLTNDTKSLKSDLLETSMLPLQIKYWYRKWDNYQSHLVGAKETITEISWPTSEQASAMKYARP